MDFVTLVQDKAKLLGLDETFMKSGLNEGFSGGEKKKNEVFQMAVLEPKFCVLDETDSGLDIDACGSWRTASTRCVARSGRCSSSRTTSVCSTTSFRTSSTS